MIRRVVLFSIGPFVASLFFAVLLTLGSGLALPTAAAQEGPSAGLEGDPQVEAVAKRIRELQEEIARLLGALTPEQKEAVRERLSRLETPRSSSSAAAAAAAAAEETKDVDAGTDTAVARLAEPEIEARPEPAPEEMPAEVSDTEEEAAPIRTEPVEAPEAESPSAGRQGCQTLVPFDSDGDGKLTGLDRYWRHFYLWTDRNGDGEPDETEMEPPYESGIREIALHLRSFVKGKKKKARSQEILVDELLLFDVANNGWDGAIPRGDDGALALDAGALAHSGGPRWLDAQGRQVEGIRPLRAGGRFELADGTVVVIDCP